MFLFKICKSQQGTPQQYVEMCIWMLTAQVSRKLTFLYLANDVIQNSKKKGPEFTEDFAPVIVNAFKHVYRSVFLERVKMWPT